MRFIPLRGLIFALPLTLTQQSNKIPDNFRFDFTMSTNQIEQKIKKIILFPKIKNSDNATHKKLQKYHPQQLSSQYQPS